MDDEFMTRNNRLERCEVYAGEDDAGPLLRTVKYLYYKTGDVSNITVKDEYHDPNLTPGDPNDYQWYNDLAFYYDKGKNVRMVLRGRWKSDGEGGFEDYERHWSREFMYDNPRARFMARELDPADFHPYTADDPNTPGVDEGAWLWTDYVGTTPTLDLELRTIGSDPDELSVVEKRSYGPGGWQDLAYDPNDPNAPPTVSATRYAHGDLIDSAVLTTNESATAVATAAYTAFGEIIGPGSVGVPPANMQTRYRYAGGHGYEADVLHGAHAPLNGPNPNLAPITLLHVGARWYDPSIGRFVQRDPIGLGGGINVYAYVDADPITRIDPDGLSWIGDLFGPEGPIFGKRSPLNNGKYRLGWSGDGFGGGPNKRIWRFALRIGPRHIYCWTGIAAPFVLAIECGLLAAEMLDIGTEIGTGRSLRRQLGWALWPWVGGSGAQGGGVGYDPDPLTR